MKKIKKNLAILLSVISIFGIVGCGGVEGSDVKENAGITYLYVGNYGGGFGEDWLKNIGKAFEEKYKDYSFEEGKTGVKVQPVTNKNTMSGNALISTMKTQQRETVFFTIDALYNDFIKENLLYDITDIVSATLPDENKSIKDKMTKEAIDYFTVDNKIYAIPFCDIFTGIIYDVDLFEEKGFYFKEDGNFVEKENGANKSLRSKGPDGKTGVIDGVDHSVDDGLPATFEQFYQLCNEIVKKGCIPFIWTGEYLNYLNQFLYSVAADILGKDEMMLNFTANGISNNIEGETNYTIDETNAQMLAKQTGKKQALEFAKNIVDNSNWYIGSKCFSGAFSHTQAQEYFVGAKYDGAIGKPAAMLIEGNYWQNEASSAFEEIAEFDESAAKSNRRYATMPIPKVASLDLGDRTIATYGNSLCFMSANCSEDKVKVSKMFIQFAHTDAQLKVFTELTDIARPYDYDIGTSYDKLTYFGKDLWNLRSSANIVADYRTSTKMKRNPSSFTINTFWGATGTSNNPFEQFYGDKSYTVDQYFNAMYTYNNNLWKN